MHGPLEAPVGRLCKVTRLEEKRRGLGQVVAERSKEGVGSII